MTYPALLKVLPIAMAEIGTVEAPGHHNSGKRINEYQAVTGNSSGDSWCMSYVMWCLVHAFQGSQFPPLPKSGRCQTVREAAHKLGWALQTPTPQPMDIGLIIDTRRDHAHHTFWVTGKRMFETKAFPTCEGNTNTDGSREGYGVFARHRRSNDGLTYEFIRIPT